MSKPNLINNAFGVWIFVLPVLVAIFVTAYTTYYLQYSKVATTTTQTPIAINAINTATGTIKLSIPNFDGLTFGTTTSLPINVKATTATKIVAIQVELLYDEKRIAIESITNNATLFPTVLYAPAISNGRIRFSYGVAPETGGKVIPITNVKLATINLRPLTGSGGRTTKISFDDESMVAAVDTPENMLASVVESTITIAREGTTQKTDFVAPVGVDLQDWNSMSSVWDRTGTTAGIPGAKRQDVAGAGNTGPDGLVNNYDMSVLIREFNR